MSMDINNVQSINALYDVSAVTPTSGQVGSADTSSSTSAVSIDLSKPGKLFSELQSLASSDPAKFKAVTADIASQLKDAASSTTGKQADALNKIADRFEAASQSGKASDLVPAGNQGQHVHHGGHHHHAQAAAASDQTGSGTSNDSVIQTVQQIIANALGNVSGG
jgi:hypothetical protein